MQKTKLIRYCVVCAAIFLAAILCWSMVWRLDTIQMALTEMEAVEDDALRRSEYFWVGSTLFLSSLAAAGVFCMAFLVLEKPMLGIRPNSRKQPWKLDVWGILLGIPLIALIPDNLFWKIYVDPWVSFGFAALLFVWRVRSRMDDFPPMPDSGSVGELRLDMN